MPQDLQDFISSFFTWVFRISILFLLYWIGRLIEQQTKYLKDESDIDEIGK